MIELRRSCVATGVARPKNLASSLNELLKAHNQRQHCTDQAGTSCRFRRPRPTQGEHVDA